jgi:hypothetical protein
LDEASDKLERKDWNSRWDAICHWCCSNLVLRKTNKLQIHLIDFVQSSLIGIEIGCLRQGWWIQRFKNTAGQQNANGVQTNSSSTNVFRYRSIFFSNEQLLSDHYEIFLIPIIININQSINRMESILSFVYLIQTIFKRLGWWRDSRVTHLRIDREVRKETFVHHFVWRVEEEVESNVQLNASQCLTMQLHLPQQKTVVFSVPISTTQAVHTSNAALTNS